MYQLIFIITTVIICVTLTITYEKHKENTRHIYYGRLFSRIKSVTQEDVVNELILKWLQEALIYYKNSSTTNGLPALGLCCALLYTLPTSKEYRNLCHAYTGCTHIRGNDISKIIPEFKSTYFGLNDKPEHEYWWDEDDRESRINALNKLIDLYEKKINRNMLFIAKEIDKTPII